MIKVLIFVLIMLAVIGFFWHDEIKVYVAKWQNQAEQQGPDLIKQGQQATADFWNNYAKEQTDKYVAMLTAEGKKKIDQYLAEKKLNQYGDKLETNYLGGTPLYDEATGKSIDKYAYILKKHPEIVTLLNLSQFIKKN
jgi:hypothetical protein